MWEIWGREEFRREVGSSDLELTISQFKKPHMSCPQVGTGRGNLCRVLWKTVACERSGLDCKEFACNAGEPGSILVSGRFLGGGNSNSLDYSCLEKPMDRGAWQGQESMGPQRVRHDWTTKLFHFSLRKTVPMNKPQPLWVHSQVSKGGSEPLLVSGATARNQEAKLDVEQGSQRTRWHMLCISASVCLCACLWKEFQMVVATTFSLPSKYWASPVLASSNLAAYKEDIEKVILKLATQIEQSLMTYTVFC